MVLSLRERRMIADMERSLTEEEPDLSRRLAELGGTRPEPSRPPDGQPDARHPESGRRAQDRAGPVPPAPPPMEPPPEVTAFRRAQRVALWSLVLALALLGAALALSAAGLLTAAFLAALTGVACCATYHRAKRRRQSIRSRPPGG
jgi:DUF3040 family protein